jgi:hypothetical protein
MIKQIEKTLIELINDNFNLQINEFKISTSPKNMF